MSKKVLFWIFVGLLFICFSMLAAGIVLSAKNYSITLAENIFSQAQDAKEDKDTLILLIQSEIIWPTDEKKILIAKIFYKTGNISEAIHYLKKVDCNKERIACDYLAELSVFEIQNSLNEGIPQDYLIYKEILNGNFTVISELPTTPVTNIGKLLSYINGQKQTEIDLIDTKTVEIINSDENDNTKSLTLAAHLNKLNRPYLALFTLEKINEKTKQNHLIKAASYELIENFGKAYSEIETAIMADPSDIILYERIFEVAKKMKNPENIETYQENYNRLINLKS